MSLSWQADSITWWTSFNSQLAAPTNNWTHKLCCYIWHYIITDRKGSYFNLMTLFHTFFLGYMPWKFPLALWPNRIGARRRKLETWVYLRFRLARHCMHLHWLAMPFNIFLWSLHVLEKGLVCLFGLPMLHKFILLSYSTCMSSCQGSKVLHENAKYKILSSSY